MGYPQNFHQFGLFPFPHHLSQCADFEVAEEQKTSGAGEEAIRIGNEFR